MTTGPVSAAEAAVAERSSRRTALVFGSTGFIGRWLVVELVAQGVPVIAAVRTQASGETLRRWLGAHGVETGVEFIEADFQAADLGVDDAALAGTTEIHNLAGAFRFGMPEQEAYDGNVVTGRRIVELAARLPRRPRVVHVSGYRVGSHGDTVLTGEARAAAYRRLGAYEASKIEADGVVKQTATELGVPYTIVNPSTVSGHSGTGESEQQIGLAATVRDLWQGRLAALPGNAETFVPVVTIDYLAKFMAPVPTLDETRGKSYWVLDDDTPGLREMLTLIGRHYRVREPRLSLPVGVIRKLPRGLTKVDPETLSFLDSARYPTAEAQELAVRHGLVQPETVPALLRWADYLAAHRFGAVRPGDPVRRFIDVAGTRTFSLGNPDADTVVLPPLPLNADSWAEIANAFPDDLQVVDLPGLGLSSGDVSNWTRWPEDLLAHRPNVHLIGHSIGAAYALEYAASYPDKLNRLTLVAPAFLQPRAGALARSRLVATLWLRRTSPESLAARLLGDKDLAPKLTSSVQDLRRPTTARRIANLLHHGANPTRRAALAQTLAAYPGRVHLITGEQDPLTPAATAAFQNTLTTIPNAGHYPQLTHPTELLRHLTSATAAL
ncbi:alpha/beta fold hydrolase [Kribbella solani]|uniref:alpha/beta fold hydrolase n=1 Tax=Kribbella solani TaxID=236067 RepID=UPI0029A62C11|nr:alpha/beta fold hydrolase [Kribbella solani]MDX2968891.1 alpha/beta fold hydrolase [Kribbella solani]